MTITSQWGGLFLSLALGLGACSSVTPQTEPIEQARESTARVLALKGQRNFRDLGGYETTDGKQTRWGRLYRSGELSKLNAADYGALSKLNIDLVVDFRDGEEQKDAETNWQAETRPEFLDLPIGGSAADWSSRLSRQLRSGNFTQEEIRQSFIAAYEQIPIENATDYGKLFNEILDRDTGAVLFHCTAGKDRTGIASALILSALDVPRETIMQDYMLTNEVSGVDQGIAFIAQAFSARAGRQVDPEALRPLVGVEEIYLQTSFDTIEKAYGSVEAYLEQEMGLTEEKRAQLKDLLLQ